jgi:hypothetical protein
MASTITNLRHTKGPSPGAAREQPPICESHLAWSWRRFAAKAPRHKSTVDNLQNFIALNGLRGGVDAEL